jgi:hypothetical protein
VRRPGLFAAIALVAVLCLAQRPRDDYRAASTAWRQTDPNLEQEASAGGASVAQRADRMAAEAAKFAAARKAFLEGTLNDHSQQVAWLESAAAEAEPAAVNTKPDSQFIATETARVTRTIDTFLSDPDKGIQQLRQALARERVALDAIGQAVVERQKSADAVDLATAAIEPSRTKSLEQARAMLEGLKDALAQNTREAEAWTEYYRKLGEGLEGTATPITQVPLGVPPATLSNPAPAPPTITPVPLARYVGAWAFPQSNGLFHGAQPESVEVLVNEENGHVTGTASARFKLPAGSKDDPVLRFDFSGDLQPTRNQIFNLVTSDGTKGTMELIPGPAFNLLEVNIQTEPKPGKIRQADVVLVKK